MGDFGGDQEILKCTFQALIDNFSNENIHIPGNPTEVKKLFIKDDIDLKYFPRFYANGNNNANKGYVSIVWDDYTRHGNLIDLGHKVVYIVSVMDVDRNTRFTQSLSLEKIDFEKGKNPKSGFNKYIARDTLLCQSNELLHKDTLIIQIDVYWINICTSIRLNMEMNSYVLSGCIVHEKSNELYLLLDSGFGKRLCEESSYFNRMSETPMLEKETGLWKISEEESRAFVSIAHIMWKNDFIDTASIPEVYFLYKVADKYDIPIVIENCRHLFGKHICDRNFGLILEMAHEFNDSILKQIVERFQNDFVYRKEQNEKNSASMYERMLDCIFNQKPKLDFYT